LYKNHQPVKTIFEKTKGKCNMKATGIVRRIDDLGRVVIPKEIRRTLRIREGDPLEIFTASDGEVIFKKYSPMGELSEFAVQYTDVLSRATSKPIIICDRDRVISASGIPKREMLERRISESVEMLMQSRSSYIASPSANSIYPVDGSDRQASVIYPIIGSGDISGAVIMLFSEKDNYPTQTDIKLVQVAASFLGKQTEE
jgi:AbrB family transcriptional regulator (stage V sporulation protein T)